MDHFLCDGKTWKIVQTGIRTSADWISRNESNPNSFFWQRKKSEIRTCSQKSRVTRTTFVGRCQILPIRKWLKLGNVVERLHCRVIEPSYKRIFLLPESAPYRHRWRQQKPVRSIKTRYRQSLTAASFFRLSSLTHSPSSAFSTCCFRTEASWGCRDQGLTEREKKREQPLFFHQHYIY